MRLPLYDGALRRRIEIEQNEGEGAPEFYNEHGEKKNMTMREALETAKNGETTDRSKNLGVLSSLNEESLDSPFGALFDYSVG